MRRNKLPSRIARHVGHETFHLRDFIRFQPCADFRRIFLSRCFRHIDIGRIHDRFVVRPLVRRAHKPFMLLLSDQYGVAIRSYQAA